MPMMGAGRRSGAGRKRSDKRLAAGARWLGVLVLSLVQGALSTACGGAERSEPAESVAANAAAGEGVEEPDSCPEFPLEPCRDKQTAAFVDTGNLLESRELDPLILMERAALSDEVLRQSVLVNMQTTHYYERVLYATWRYATGNSFLGLEGDELRSWIRQTTTANIQ